MSFPRYSEYKDSGVEWLGEVPGHWTVNRIGYYFNERREKVSDKDFGSVVNRRPEAMPSDMPLFCHRQPSNPL